MKRHRRSGVWPKLISMSMLLGLLVLATSPALAQKLSAQKQFSFPGARNVESSNFFKNTSGGTTRVVASSSDPDAKSVSPARLPGDAATSDARKASDPAVTTTDTTANAPEVKAAPVADTINTATATTTTTSATAPAAATTT
ncbi:MAG TPA: hypothetical protein VER76_15650, partial [Pyrinomonadaceae bacterium]|nr:hypothetical protein [Pyrinomonadaceae bacterium]